MSDLIDLDTFVVGEKPNVLEYQFQNADGVAIDISGYTVKFIVKERDSLAVTFNATLSNGAQGKVQHVWDGTEFPTPGTYQARFWVGNGTQRFASALIQWKAADSQGPVPAI